jgi:hypothetical protein
MMVLIGMIPEEDAQPRAKDQAVNVGHCGL